MSHWIKVFKGQNNTQATVSQSQSGFHVQLWDMDASEALPWVKTFKSLILAEYCAKRIVSGKDADLTMRERKAIDFLKAEQAAIEYQSDDDEGAIDWEGHLQSCIDGISDGSMTIDQAEDSLGIKIKVLCCYGGGSPGPSHESWCCLYTPFLNGVNRCLFINLNHECYSAGFQAVLKTTTESLFTQPCQTKCLPTRPKARLYAEPNQDHAQWDGDRLKINSSLAANAFTKWRSLSTANIGA
jgi:hypothetical protein